MRHVSTRALLRPALVAAALMAIAAPAAAYAGTPATADRPASAAAGEEYSYTMNLSVSAATVRPGGVTTTVITFDASPELQGQPVDLSVTGLPAGACATFAPRRPRVGGQSTLTISTTAGTPAGTATLTVSAIINGFSSDPIGTTAPFALTVGG